jgi:phosphohistidine phosphatase SixA
MRYKILLLTLGLLFSSIHVLAQDQTVFLVRHAEKILDTGTDPALTEQGRQRAIRLSELLKASNPVAIYTSQYQRTQQTGQPLATVLNIPLTVITIDKNNTEQYPALLLERICALPKGSNALVIGHSNSIPGIVEAWTHESVKPIADNEYDRLFLVRLNNCQIIGNMDIRY